ncbi:TIGR03084 family metal-binding protein [Actinomycetes bacterium KLBMP 9797]
MSELSQVIAALTADAAEVDALVADLDPARWRLPTPAEGWTTADQIGHLAFIFRIAGMAAGRPAAFQELTARVADVGFDAAVNAALADYAQHQPPALLARWRSERDAGIRALAAVPAGQVVPWLVNPLPPDVLARAGMMELFGHGQDIADALGVARVHTDRIGHLVGFGVRTWEFGYQARGQQPPAEPFRFELTAPSGALWTYGPAGAAQCVRGPAVDFCLLVTRRRHRADLALTAVGRAADDWLDIAQAYRGPAGPGRRPGQFTPVHQTQH